MVEEAAGRKDRGREGNKLSLEGTTLVVNIPSTRPDPLKFPITSNGH